MKSIKLVQLVHVAFSVHTVGCNNMSLYAITAPCDAAPMQYSKPYRPLLLWLPGAVAE